MGGFDDVFAGLLGTSFGMLIIGMAYFLLMSLLCGYLFNYFLIKELREMNRKLRDIDEDLLALKYINSKSTQQQQTYKMKSENNNVGETDK